jgi:hypothetical protein
MSDKYEPEYPDRPQITAFFTCRDVVIERDNLVSAFRLIDSAQVRILENSERAQFPEPVDLMVFIGFAHFGIKVPHRYMIQLELLDPNGESRARHTIDADLKPESPIIYRGVQTNVSGKLPGVYTFNLSVDEKFIASTFFRVIKAESPLVVHSRPQE